MSDRLFTTASFPFVGRAGETENNAGETQAEITSGFCQVIQEVMFPEKNCFIKEKLVVLGTYNLKENVEKVCIRCQLCLLQV